MIFRRTLTQPLKFLFSTPKQPFNQPQNNSSPPDYPKVHINSDRIQKRMQQIQKRKDKNQKLKVSDLMPDFNTYKLPAAIQKFRRQTNSQNIFVFETTDVKPKHDYLNVDAFAPGMLEVNEIQYPSSLILYNKQVLLWEVASAANITLQHFDILKVLDPRPEYIILAVNNRDDLNLTEQEVEKIRQIADIDILQLFQGIGTFNMSSQDQIKVAMFIISQ